MEILKNAFDFLRPGFPLAATLVIGVLVIVAVRRLLVGKYSGQTDKRMRMQLIVLLMSLVLLVLLVIVSPIHDNQKGQILSLIGIVLSAAIALSSTTFVGNAMAGMMLRAVKGFRVGDFIAVGDNFGRVSERGLFHVEIQTEMRDLITLPNLHLVTNPVKVIRSNGTLVFAEVSLGYDIPRDRIREALLKAAEDCGLEEPFVHVMNMGDFSVVYRVSGLLTEVKQLISTRSRLRECVLDRLHGARIEVVSPTFMNTRQLASDRRFIPEVVRTVPPDSGHMVPEEIVFDKADEAASLEQLRERLGAMDAEIKELESTARENHDDEARERANTRIDNLRRSREALAAHLEAAEKERKESGGE